MDISNDKSAAPAARDDAHLTPAQAHELIFDSMGFLAARNRFGRSGWLPYIEARGFTEAQAEALSVLAEAQACPRDVETMGLLEACQTAEIGCRLWPCDDATHNRIITDKCTYKEAFLPPEVNQAARYYCEIVQGSAVVGRRQRALGTPFELGMATAERWAKNRRPGGGWGWLLPDDREELARIKAEVARMQAAGRSWEGVEA